MNSNTETQRLFLNTESTEDTEIHGEFNKIFKFELRFGLKNKIKPSVYIRVLHALRVYPSVPSVFLSVPSVLKKKVTP